MDESSSTPVLIGDAELIGAIASGDSAAYATLRDRHEPAARSLARQLVTDPAEADEVVSETFTRLHGVIRRGGGPGAAVRPYLLAAVRRVAGERSGGPPAGMEAGERPGGPPPGTAGGEAERPSPGEPLPGDPAAEAESEPLARAFLSLPERWRAVLWHTEIEQADPGQAAVVLGVTAQGLAELGEQARAGLSRAYLKLYLAGVTREDCRSAAGKLDLHLSGAARGHNEGKVQRHLRGCRPCRAVAVELAGPGRSLRRAVAPVFLGPATAAYLAAVKVAPAHQAGAPAGTSAGTWVTSRLPAMSQAARRPRRALVAGVLLLAVLVVTGLTLAVAGNTAPPRTALHPAAAAAAPSRPAATVPLPLPAPARSQPAAPATPVTPTVPASPSPLDPDAATSPSPSPLAPDHHRHRRHHHDPDQPSAP
jgi:DNA-directed RNA polymerase specialized sigma24 family protein